MTRKQKKALLAIIIASVLTLVIFITLRFVEIEWWIELLLYIIPYLTVGYKVLWDAVRGILKGQVLDEKFLMALATIGAFVLLESVEAVMVMLFYQIGELFQSIAVGKSRRSITAMLKLRPDEGVVIKEEEEIVTPLEEVRVGDRMKVLAGDRIPLDGKIVLGTSAVDTSALTGESIPKDVCVGDVVIGGCLNMSGVLEIEVTSPYEESTLSKILELVENSSAKKAKSEKFITKFAKFYTPVVVISALLLAIVPSLIKGAGEWSVWQEQIKRALIFLVVSCPCALVISVPLTFFSGIGSASKNGILIKGSSFMEALSKLKTVVCDKTGTLTKGVFGVSRVMAVDGNEEALINKVAKIEKYSNHPIALSIVAEATETNGNVEDVTEEAGYGLRAKLDGKSILVGNAKLLDKYGIEHTIADEPGTVIYAAEEGVFLGSIVINDVIKETSPMLVEKLREVGVERLAILTGDSEKVAKDVAEKLHVTDVYAELLPQDKARIFDEMISSKKPNTTVAFVGDGVNDAPVLMRADVGIAMGGLGSDVAIESADVVLMKDDPLDVAKSIRISRKTMRIVYENIVFALGVKFAVLILGAFGIANMLLAIFADVGVCVLAILNAIRAFRIKN